LATPETTNDGASGAAASVAAAATSYFDFFSSLRMASPSAFSESCRSA
jgi:hypothetical protein